MGFRAQGLGQRVYKNQGLGYRVEGLSRLAGFRFTEMRFLRVERFRVQVRGLSSEVESFRTIKELREIMDQFWSRRFI